MLGAIKGKFIMSINDVAPIRELFKAFNIKEVNTAYGIQNGKKQKVNELLILNY